MGKTTVAGIVIGIILIVLVAAVLVCVIDATSFAVMTGSIGTLGVVIVGILSQDQKKNEPKN